MGQSDSINGNMSDENSDHSQLDAASTVVRRSSPNPPAGNQQQPLISLQQPPPQNHSRLQRSNSVMGRVTSAQPPSHPLSYTFATSAAAAAAATSAKSRPKLNVSTSLNPSASSSSLPSPPSALSSQPIPGQVRRRLWFRKKAGGPATSLLVECNELVDDVKSRILMKYPTSLLQNCDPADLVVTLSPNGSSKVELQPDENIWAVLDKYYSSGMTIHDALELSLPGSTQLPTPSAQPARVVLQRARSYSNNTHYQGYKSLSPSITGSAPPMPQAHHGSPEPNTPMSISPHGASPGAQMSSHSSTGPHSPTTEVPQDSRHNTSVLLMPRQLGGPSGPLSVNAERELDGHATTLVPLTGEPSTSSSSLNHSWSEGLPNQSNQQANNNNNNNNNNGTPLHSISASFVPSSGLASLQLGKSSVVPQINVLIVEDNKINQLILERFLQRKTVRCAVATNGREALEKWRTGGFHLILMDIQLPEMSGLEVTKEIRRLEIVNGIGAFPQAFRGHDLPAAPVSEDVLPKSEGGFRSPVIIVALTASSEMLDKSEALAAGCNDFLTKPVNLTWLEQKITEWGCMQALIDYAGWKQWSADSPSRSLSRVELTGQSENSSASHQKQMDHSQDSQEDPHVNRSHNAVAT